MSVGASGRVLDVNAFTTVDYVPAAVRGPDWSEEAPAVIDVRSPDEAEGAVLEVELDGTALERVEPHADSVRLAPDQARALADALVAATDGAARDRGDDDGR